MARRQTVSREASSGVFSQMSITIPDHSVLNVMEILLTAQELFKQDGIDAKIQMRRNVDIDGRPVTASARRPLVIPDELVAGGAVEEAVQAPATRRLGKNAVKYRVINPAIKTGQVPHEVRMFILQHGPTTAREIEEATGKGRKSVESALYGLRASGSIESVPDTGQVIKQKRFGKKVIAAGTPAQG